MSRNSFGQTVVAGIWWTAGQIWLTHLVRLGLTAVLARILGPTEFGLVAIAMAYMTFTELFVDSGMSDAIVQREDIKPEHLDSAFWASLAVGVVGAGVTLVGAGPIASLLGDADVEPILTVMSPYLVLVGLVTVQGAILRKRLAFRLLAVRRIGALTAGGIAGVVLALLGAGVWALVGMYLTNAVVGAVVLWSVSDWRPGGRFSRSAFRDLIGFGGAVFFSRILKIGTVQVPNVIIARFLGTADVGYYNIAFRVLSVVKMSVQGIGNVAFPAFASVQRDRQRLAGAFMRMSEATAWIALPAFAGLAILAQDLVPLLFGPGWEIAVPLVTIFSIAGLFEALTSFTGAMLNASGQPFRQALYNLGRATVTVAALIVAAQYGLQAVAWAYTAETLITFPFGLMMVRRYVVEFSPAQYSLDLLRPAGASALMMVLVVFAQIALEPVTSVLLRVIVAVGVGMLSYVMALRLIAGKRFDYFVRTGVAPLKARLRR